MKPRFKYVLPQDILHEAKQRCSSGEQFEAVVEELSARKIRPEIHGAARELFHGRRCGQSFPAVLSMLLDPNQRVVAATLLAQTKLFPDFPSAYTALEKGQAECMHRPAAVVSLVEMEEQMLAEEAAAKKQLEEIGTRITLARARVSQLFTVREKLRIGIDELRDEISALNMHRAAAASRREHFHSQIVRDLSDSPSAQPAWPVLTEMGMKVAASDIILAEVDRIVGERKSSLESLENELAAYEAAHVSEFSPAAAAS